MFIISSHNDRWINDNLSARELLRGSILNSPPPGNCSPPITGESEGVEYPKGEVVGEKIIPYLYDS